MVSNIDGSYFDSKSMDNWKVCVGNSHQWVISTGNTGKATACHVTGLDSDAAAIPNPPVEASLIIALDRSTPFFC